jgi:toxin ParE1/3/4
VTVRFTSRAVGDLDAVLNHYDDIGPDLRMGFGADFESAIERLIMFPNGAPPVEGLPGVRRARMRRFPYGIFYRPGTEESVVLRVVPAKQHRATALDQR